MKSQEINQAIRDLDNHGPEKPILYFGWYWRDVDWDADGVTLAVTSEAPPSWWAATLEARTGTPYPGRSVGFCENNKWGYHEFRVNGQEWDDLKARVMECVRSPTDESRAELMKFLESIAPPDSQVSVP